MRQNTQLERNHELEIVITRAFNAPRNMVWNAWTEPERLMQWWGPKGFSSPVWKTDLRVSGKYLAAMQSPDGQIFWSTGVYREVVKPGRLVMTDSFADENGDVVPASYYGMSGAWPSELLITVTLEEYDGKTKMTLKHSGISGISDTDRDSMKQGWDESFDKLTECLK